VTRINVPQKFIRSLRSISITHSVVSYPEQYDVVWNLVPFLWYIKFHNSCVCLRLGDIKIHSRVLPCYKGIFSWCSSLETVPQPRKNGTVAAFALAPWTCGGTPERSAGRNGKRVREWMCGLQELSVVLRTTFCVCRLYRCRHSRPSASDGQSQWHTASVWT